MSSTSTIPSHEQSPHSDADSLESSRRYVREVSRREARNFYYGMKLTPRSKRDALYAVYAWMRRADDLADEQGDPRDKAARLEQFRGETDRALSDRSQLPPGPLWPALRDAVLEYDIPVRYLHQMLDAQQLDQHKTRYADFNELYDYCYKVASVVGLTCIEIWGYQGKGEGEEAEHVRRMAEWRGIAFQLTNILRDVREDAQRGRVYLPPEDFHVYEIAPSMFTLKVHHGAVRGLTHTARRAREYYEKSAALDRWVHPDGRACLGAMTRIYRGLLEKILADPASVLRGTPPRLSPVRKSIIAARASLTATWGRG